MNTSDIDICSCCEVHDDCVECVKENMLKDDVFYGVADLFKVLGDYTRIKIIYALSKKELCVCDISEVIGMSQSAVSHQLRILKSANLVKFRREGKVVYYSLDDDHITKLFGAGVQHVQHTK